MSYEAHVSYDFAAQLVDVWLADRRSRREPPAVGHFDANGDLVMSVPDDHGAAQPPTMRLPLDMAQDLLTALSRELNSSPHVHDHTREDFEHERDRVDRMLDVLLRKRVTVPSEDTADAERGF